MRRTLTLAMVVVGIALAAVGYSWGWCSWSAQRWSTNSSPTGSD
jgi:hypothetical protein